MRGGGELRHRWREMAGDAPSSVQGRARVEIGSRARGGFQERTRNMKLMSVTLDVSKLSGWLNAEANCRVERRAYIWCGTRCGPPVWEGAMQV